MSSPPQDRPFMITPVSNDDTPSSEYTSGISLLGDEERNSVSQTGSGDQRELPLVKIAPKPPGDPPASNSTINPRKRKINVLAACKECRKRKLKCSGTRPVCIACANRGQECEYDVAPGSSKREVDRRKVDLIKAEHAILRSVVMQIRDAGPEEVKRVLQQLRDGGIEGLDDTTTDRHDSSLEQGYLDDTSQVPRSGPPNVRQDIASIPEESITISLPSNHSMLGLLHLILPKKHVFEVALEAYHNSVGELFHTYTRLQTNSMFDAVFREGRSIKPSAELTQLCGIAALGSMYSQGQVSGDLIERFYSVTKQYLDALIDGNTLSAIKTALMLAQCNIVCKSTTAMSFLNLGLYLSRKSGLDRKHRPANIDPGGWLDLRRVWRTLTLCNGWMASTTGISADTDWFENHSALEEMDLGESMQISDMIQFEMAKIATLKANMLKSLTTSTRLGSAALSQARKSLRDWHERLPRIMTLNSLLSDSSLDGGNRVRVLYVHLVYLGGLMLLPRIVARRWTAEKRSVDDLFSHDAVVGFSEGFLAAQQSARVLSLLLEYKGVVVKCWLCTFQSYTSSLMMLFQLIQSFLLDLNKTDPEGIMPLIDQSLDCLKFCAAGDEVATSLYNCLHPHVEVLRKERELRMRCIPTPPSDNPALQSRYHPFFIPAGDSILHHTATALFKLISQPFEPVAGMGNEQIMQATQKSVEETYLGSHLEWQWEARSSPSIPDECAFSKSSDPGLVNPCTIVSEAEAMNNMLTPGASDGSRNVIQTSNTSTEEFDSYDEDASPPDILYAGSRVPNGWVEEEMRGHVNKKARTGF